MKRLALGAAILILSAGCQAPTPSWHAPMPDWNMFRPANATRVPPPPTGGYGAAQPYYTTPPTTAPSTIAPTSAPVGTGFRPSTSNRWSNIDDPVIGPIAKENTWAPTRPAQSNTQIVDLRDMDVALASHETAAPFVPSTVVVERDGPIRILPPEYSRSLSVPATSQPPRLRGMVVNDATRAAEPRTFVPSGRVIDISQLPDAPVAARSTNNPTSTTPRQSSTSQATVIDGGWKSRSTTLRVAGA